MQNLNEALTDLAETIIEDGFTETLVADIAGDYDLHPALLGRKFEEKYGNTPANHTGKTAAEKAAMETVFYNAKVNKAMERAIRTASHYSGGTVPSVVGKGFKFEGDDYVAVVISTRGLVCVRVHDAAEFTINNGRRALETAQRFGLC